MTKHRRWMLLALLLPLASAIVLAVDTEFEKEHARLVAANPAGLTLRLELEKEAFRLDEVIPVTLEFENRSDTAYEVWTGTYDRSGRIHDIAFHLEGPADGFVDPLADFFLLGGIGGGLNGHATLGRHEQTFTLNEWIRFDLPGRYRLYCTTWRVRTKQDADGTGKHVELCSPIVTLTILPSDPDDIIRKTAAAKVSLQSDNEESRQSAARTLRFLATPEATEALIPVLHERRIGGEAMAGCIGARDKEHAKRLLVRYLQEPDIIVNDRYIRTMASLLIPEERYAAARDADPRTDRTPYDALHNALDDAHEAALDQLAAALPKKRGRALAEACRLLVRREQEIQGLRAKFAESFDFLPEEEQKSVLEFSWDRVKCAEFEPVLERLIATPAQREDWNAWSLRSLALLRYTEFQPEVARALILEDLRRPRPLMAGRVLTSLPDETIPELDDIFVANLSSESDPTKLAYLIERYATARILPEVVAFYKAHENSWACEMQQQLLSYWVKHDRADGLEAVARAARLRERTKCYRRVLGAVLPLHYGPDAERLALSFLDDEDLAVVMDVVQILGRHGSRAAIDPLLDRLEKTNSDNGSSTDGGSYTSHSVHNEIVHCLMDRSHWQLSRAQQNRLQSLLRSPYEKERFSRLYGSEP